MLADGLDRLKVLVADVDVDVVNNEVLTGQPPVVSVPTTGTGGWVSTWPVVFHRPTMAPSAGSEFGLGWSWFLRSGWDGCWCLR